MDIQVKYFASLREALGPEETVRMTLQAPTVGDLRAALIERGGPHAQALARDRSVRCALDHRMCGEATLLHHGAEVAFFPPVTGG